MLRLSTRTKLAPAEVVKRAVSFYGPGGYGLEVTQQTDSEAAFQGGGGGVQLAASAQGDETEVEVISQEWDYQTREFIRRIH
jgi:alpha-D-ribose 1-methylphosphonate 5-phosphate C-P lyase